MSRDTGVNEPRFPNGLTKAENDKLQTALMRDKLAGLRMEGGDYKGAMEALSDQTKGDKA